LSYEHHEVILKFFINDEFFSSAAENV